MCLSLKTLNGGPVRVTKHTFLLFLLICCTRSTTCILPRHFQRRSCEANAAQRLSSGNRTSSRSCFASDAALFARESAIVLCSRGMYQNPICTFRFCSSVETASSRRWKSSRFFGRLPVTVRQLFFHNHPISGKQKDQLYSNNVPSSLAAILSCPSLRIPSPLQ